jgi:dTDP-4-dehydrorhamnose 3,5-epimerase
MRKRETPLPGLFVIELDPKRDERGYFTRTFCRDTFRAWGLRDCGLQISVSFNAKRGTLRGMHYQAPPHQETKLVRCSRGRIFDVAVDLRADSPTRGRWFGIELSPDMPVELYIPRDFAHGFVTLEDDSEIHYQMAELYVAGAARGFHWNSPDVAIDWPIRPQIVSAADESLPEYRAGIAEYLS